MSKSHCSKAGDPPKGWSFFLASTPFIVIAFLFAGCAGLPHGFLSPPLDPEKILEIVTKIQEQHTRVTTFYSMGNIVLTSWHGETESGILIVGSRDPYRMKMELTHSWGQPILHLLIDHGRLQALSFSEKRLYVGSFTPSVTARFFPEGLDADLIWAALRGFPRIDDYFSITSRRGNQIAVLGPGGEEVKSLELYPESFIPRLVRMPEQHLRTAFLEIQEEEGIYYAKRVEVEHTREGKRLILTTGNMVFNKTIPDEIFKLERPPAFETCELD